MASISSLGVGSGLDLNSLLAQLRTAESQRLTPIKDQETSYKAKLTGVSAVKSALDKFNTANNALAKSESFGIIAGSIDAITNTKVSSTNKAFTAITGSKSVAGTYNVEVKQLAQAHSLSSAVKASATDALSATDTTLTIAQAGGKPLTVDIKGGETSLNGVRDAINKANGGVTASVVKAKDNEYYLMITSKKTGDKGEMTLTDSGNILGTITEKVAAQSSIIIANGIEIERQSNTIDDAIEGVTLTLQTKTDAEKPETLTIDQDISGMKDAVKAWVDAYNALQDTIGTQTKYTEVKAGENQSATNGSLLGDSTLQGIQARLKSQLTTVQESSGEFRILADLGITQNPKTGKLVVSDTKLEKALKEEPGKVQAFFVGDSDKTGFATQTRTYLKEVLDTTEGIIKTKEDGINKTLKSLDTRQKQVSDSIEQTIARYQKQFTELDKAMSGMNSTVNQLSSMFAKL